MTDGVQVHFPNDAPASAAHGGEFETTTHHHDGKATAKNSYGGEFETAAHHHGDSQPHADAIETPAHHHEAAAGRPRIFFKAGQWSQLFVGEFLGVFFIVMIIGVTIASGNIFTAIYVGFMYLTAQVYSHIGTSGSCINPSISLCVALCRKDIIPMKELWKYQIMEFAGAFTAWLILGGIFFPSPGGAFYDENVPGFALWENVSLGNDEADGEWWFKAMLIEFLGGTLFLEVIANCACTKKDGPNQYYAMAIGFVLTPCIYFMIPISGGCINPSIGFAINFFHAVQTGNNIAGIFAFTLIGYSASFGAALIFSLGRADEFEDPNEGPLLFRFKAGQWGKLFVGEFLGVFWIIFTVGIGIMNPLYQDPAWAPWGMLLPLVVGLYLCAQVYSHLGTSGSCINPAISLCVHLCRPDVIPGNQLWKYQVMEFAGAFTGWLFVGIFYEDVWDTIQLAPNETTFWWGHVLIIEALMTMMFLEHIANCALAPKDTPNQYYGLAIGGSLAAGVVVMAPISGACINPSIGNAINLLYIMNGCQAGGGCTGKDIGYWILYIVAPYIGGVLAAVMFTMGRAGEFEGPNAVENPPSVKPRIFFQAGQWGQLFVGEFLGVFFIVMIIGVTIAAGNIFTAIYVGCMYLTAQVYCHLGTSGSCINPSISLCVALCRKDILPMKELWKYQIMEFAGAFTAWLILGGIFFPSPGGAFYDENVPGFALWENVSLGNDEADGEWWFKAMLIEFLGGTLFLEVIANCACSKKDGPNQYYAMAIGFVLTPCIYFMIPISGGCINPSIGFAINFFHAVQTGNNIAGIFAFTLIGYTASFGAALIFSLGRADEFEDANEGPLLFRFKAGQWGKLFVGEFLGVFWIIFTVGIGIMNPLYQTEAWAPWGMLLPLVVGLYLTAQVYSHLGTSGSCINPAISLCVHLCRPDVIPGNQLWKYQLMEYLGAFTGWLFVGIFYEDVWDLVQLAPNETTFYWGHAFFIEALMTGMFLEHIANCALSPKDSPNQYYGLAIGCSLAAGVVVMAPISGACINPSIANAINLLYLISGCQAGGGCTGTDIGYWILYVLATYSGGVLAAVMFTMGRAGEFPEKKVVQTE